MFEEITLVCCVDHCKNLLFFLGCRECYSFTLESMADIQAALQLKKIAKNSQGADNIYSTSPPYWRSYNVL